MTDLDRENFGALMLLEAAEESLAQAFAGDVLDEAALDELLGGPAYTQAITAQTTEEATATPSWTPAPPIPARTDEERKLDAVMEQVEKALSANRETEVVWVVLPAPGHWQIGVNGGRPSEDLNFLLGDETEPKSLQTLLYRNEKMVPKSEREFNIDKFTVRKAIKQVVKRIGYGTVDDILKSIEP